MAERMRWLKETEKGQEFMESTLQKLIDQVRAEDKIESAKALLSMGKLTLQEIASCLDLPLNQVKSLQDELRLQGNA